MKIAIAALAVIGTALLFDLNTNAQDADGRRFLNLPGRGDALPFSHAVVAGNTVYIAGTLGVDPPQPENEWGINILRGIRHVGETSAWFPLRGTQPYPDDMGHLRFG